MELTKEKSEEQAAYISMIGMYAVMIDLEYLNQVGTELRDRAMMYDTAAVLNRNYTPEKSELKDAEANAILNLCKYINSLKKVSELRDKANASQRALEEISKKFE